MRKTLQQRRVAERYGDCRDIPDEAPVKRSELDLDALMKNRGTAASAAAATSARAAGPRERVFRRSICHVFQIVLRSPRSVIDCDVLRVIATDSAVMLNLFHCCPVKEIGQVA